jgi:hypothetical protein
MPGPIPISDLPDSMQMQCECNGHPSRLRLNRAARCDSCGGWLYPVAADIPDYSAAIGQLMIAGSLRLKDPPMYTIKNWGYRTDPIEKTNFSRKYRQSSLRLGIEIELSSPINRETARNAQHVTASYAFTRLYGTLNRRYSQLPKQEASAYCIAKNDGSIPDFGTEFSCIPATTKVHLACWKGCNWDDFQDRIDCGLHVHIDRRDLSPLLVGKLSLFWNIVASIGYQQNVFGRTCTDYCEPGPTIGLQTPYQRPGWRDRPRTTGTGSNARIRHRRFSRTDAVSHRRKTVEIRLPKAPGSLKELSDALTCIECSVEFLRFYSIAAIDRDAHEKMWSDFVEFADFNAALPVEDSDKRLGEWRN